MNKLHELMQQKEGANGQVAELKLQLKLLEEARESLRHDLLEANNRIREGTPQIGSVVMYLNISHCFKVLLMLHRLVKHLLLFKYLWSNVI